MSNNTGSDSFEALLARQLRNSSPYLNDEGFTDQVAARLPARRVSKAGRWLQWLLAVVMVAVVVVQLPLRELVHGAARYLFAVDLALLLQLAVVMAGGFAVAALIWFGRELDVL